VVHVGNPPYVEAKRLPVALKTRLKADFAGVAGGAPDLWLYFLHRCLEWCRPGDGLALVLPNKVLVNRQALRLRKRLLAGGQLRSILFTSHLDLFPGASVYPVALHAERPRAGSEDEAPPIRLLHPRDRAELASPPVTTVDPAVFRATDIRALFPYPEQPPLVSLLRRLLGPGGGPRLGELFDVRWTVSFHRAGLRERFTSAERPASDLARRFLGGGRFSGNGEVRRYGIRWGGWWIDYDQEAARGAGNALPDPALFDRPKVVLCQNARVARAAYDPDGLVLKDTYLAIVPKEGGHALQRSPRALVAVLNSLLSHFLYAHLFHGSHVGGGYLHFLRSFVNDLRLGDWDASAAATAAARVRALEALDPGPEIDADDTALGALVAERFGLSPDEISALLRWGEQNPLWQTRHRVGRAAKRP